MRTLRLDCWMAVASLVLVCLSAAGFSVLPVESAGRSNKALENQPREPQADVKVCTKEKLELRVTGQPAKPFKFKCETGWKLSPVGDSDAAEAEKMSNPQPLEKGLEKVNVFVPPPSEKSCEPQGKTLDELVPGSTLQVNNANGAKSPDPPAEDLSYTLTLGAAPNEEKHLCYICKAPTARKPHEMSRSSSAATNCIIYVTVPAEEKPESPQQPDPKPDQQPGQNPDPQTDPKPDKPSDSGSFSPSVFGWLLSCVAGSVLELMVHL